MNPFDIASETGYVSSTLKLYPIGIIGRTKTPSTEIFAAVSPTAVAVGLPSVGNMKYRETVDTIDPIIVTFSERRYFSVLSRIIEHTKLPTSPEAINTAPKMLESTEV